MRAFPTKILLATDGPEDAELALLTTVNLARFALPPYGSKTVACLPAARVPAVPAVTRAGSSLDAVGAQLPYLSVHHV